MVGIKSIAQTWERMTFPVLRGIQLQGRCIIEKGNVATASFHTETITLRAAT